MMCSIVFLSFSMQSVQELCQDNSFMDGRGRAVVDFSLGELLALIGLVQVLMVSAVSCLVACFCAMRVDKWFP